MPSCSGKKVIHSWSHQSLEWHLATRGNWQQMCPYNLIPTISIYSMYWCKCLILWIQSIRRLLGLNLSQVYHPFIDQWCYQTSILDWSQWTGDRLNAGFNVALVWGLNIQTNRHWEFCQLPKLLTGMLWCLIAHHIMSASVPKGQLWDNLLGAENDLCCEIQACGYILVRKGVRNYTSSYEVMKKNNYYYLVFNELFHCLH